jgi:hypothetical protein
MRKICKNYFSASNLRTILRFERQNSNWSVQDLHKHSAAFADGLKNLPGLESNPNPKSKSK